MTELKRILREFLEWSKLYSLFPKGLIVSPLLSKGGSIEFLVYLQVGEEFVFKTDFIINEVLKDVKELISNPLGSY